MSRLSSAPVGILGSGQLAKMLAESALRMGLHPVTYEDRIEDSEALHRFLQSVSVVAFENEFVDCRQLRRIAGAEAESKFVPSLETLEVLQDKLEQKKLLARLKIPTAPFTELDPSLGSDRAIEAARKKIAGPIVLKWSKQGYDGKGVLILREKKIPASVEEFFEAAAKRDARIYAEKMIAFRRELAIIGVASVDAKGFVTYPLVVSEQENGACRRVYGPATSFGVRPALQLQAGKAARKIASETGLRGSFGIEFFETRDGKLLVNEIAPRVHNSGHYTQNAFAASQFENHWRAILGLPLFDPENEPAARKRFFAMFNILGPAGLTIDARRTVPLPLPPAGGFLHWYGKTEIRPGRKLGHLNAVAESRGRMQALLKRLEKCEKDWISELKRIPK